MGEVSTIGLDIAKSVFQVHGVDVAGAVVIRRARQSCKGAGVFWRAAGLPGRDRGVSVGCITGAATSRAGSQGEADPATTGLMRRSNVQ